MTPRSSTFESGQDDDINDVAAMGGVNLQEESQHILDGTEYVGTQIRSVKDETFLPSAALQLKIRRIGEQAGSLEVWDRALLPFRRGVVFVERTFRTS